MHEAYCFVCNKVVSPEPRKQGSKELSQDIIKHEKEKHDHAWTCRIRPIRKKP